MEAVAAAAERAIGSAMTAQPLRVQPPVAQMPVEERPTRIMAILPHTALGQRVHRHLPIEVVAVVVGQRVARGQAQVMESRNGQLAALAVLAL